jgi:hypothetical protein
MPLNFPVTNPPTAKKFGSNGVPERLSSADTLALEKIEEE